MASVGVSRVRGYVRGQGVPILDTWEFSREGSVGEGDLHCGWAMGDRVRFSPSIYRVSPEPDRVSYLTILMQVTWPTRPVLLSMLGQPLRRCPRRGRSISKASENFYSRGENAQERRGQGCGEEEVDERFSELLLCFLRNAEADGEGSMYHRD
jgi:hypothetical protein